MAARYGIPQDIFLRQINAESGWNPSARSSAGAMGLLQLMPATARSLGVSNPFNPAQNLSAGARYLSSLFHEFGNWRDALAAYNAGPGNVRSGAWERIPETVNYVKEILGDGGTAPPAVPGPTTPPRALTAPPVAPQQPRITPDVLALVNQGNQMFGLPALPSSLLTAPSVPSAQPSQAGRVAAASPKIPSVKGRAAVTLATHLLGVPYAWGGESLKGFDCSGLLQYVWAKQGVNIPRTTYDQFKAGTAVAPNALRPGDAVFFKGSDSEVVNGETLPGHVGIYIGGGKFIEAPKTGSDVRISSLKGRNDFMGARRY